MTQYQLTVDSETMQRKRQKEACIQMLAAISSSVGLLGWIIIGGLAGAVAGHVMRSVGFGLIGDIIVGVVGALVGVFLFGFLINADVGLIGSFVVALVGACILRGVMRLANGNKGRRLWR